MKTAPLSTVDEAIQNVAGSSVNEELLQVWKGMEMLKKVYWMYGVVVCEVDAEIMILQQKICCFGY